MNMNMNKKYSGDQRNVHVISWRRSTSSSQVGRFKNFCSSRTVVFMFCPPSIHITRLPTKCECFISLESITKQFMGLGNNLFVAKLKYLEGGGSCCKKCWRWRQWRRWFLPTAIAAFVCSNGGGGGSSDDGGSGEGGSHDGGGGDCDLRWLWQLRTSTSTWGVVYSLDYCIGKDFYMKKKSLGPLMVG